MVINPIAKEVQDIFDGIYAQTTSFVQNPNSAINGMIVSGDAGTGKTYTVKKALKNLLLTGKTERRFQPNYGGNIEKLLFEDISPITTNLIQKTIWDTVERFEPRGNNKNKYYDDLRIENAIKNLVETYFVGFTYNSDRVTIDWNDFLVCGSVRFNVMSGPKDVFLKNIKIASTSPGNKSSILISGSYIFVFNNCEMIFVVPILTLANKFSSCAVKYPTLTDFFLFL